MTKYFIESPDGKWITDPDRWGEYETEFLTENPFKAWAFELFLPFGDSIEKPGTGILSQLQDEDCLRGYKITKQEFTEYLEELVSHSRKLDTTPLMTQTSFRDGTSMSLVYIPLFDDPTLVTIKTSAI